MDLALIFQLLKKFLADSNNKQYDFTEAEKYYQKCKELLTNKESCIKSSDLAFVYKNLGIIYDKNQQYKESETMFKEALKIYELLANKTPGTYKK